MIEDRQQILNAVFVLKNEGLFQASRRVEMLKKGATAGLWFDLIWFSSTFASVVVIV